MSVFSKATFRRAWADLTRPRKMQGRFKSLRIIDHWWNERFTDAGRLVVTGATATVIAGAFPQELIGAWLFSILLTLTGISLAISIRYRPKVRARRRLADRVVAHTRTEMGVEIHNHGKYPAYDIGGYEFRLPEAIRILDKPQYIARLEPGQRHLCEYAIQVGKRGVYTCHGPSSISGFPFGMTQSVRFAEQMQKLVVYPHFTPLSSMKIPVGKRHQPGGLALTSKVGDSMEFIGTREYQSGDRIRDLHPRSWARVGYPVIRQYQEEYLTRVAMLVDTFVPEKLHEGQEDPPMEAALSIAASVADYLSRQDYIVDLFAAGPELYHFQAGRSLAYLENILDILACLEPCRTDPLEVVGPALRDELSNTSTLVCVFLDWDERRKTFVDEVTSLGVQTRVIVIEDRIGHPVAGDYLSSLSSAEIREGVETL